MQQEGNGATYEFLQLDVGEANPELVSPTYLTLTDDVMSMPNLSGAQKQCLASILAAYCPPGEFGEHLLRALVASAFDFQEEDEVQALLPLLVDDVDPTPFLIDMDMMNPIERGRVLLMILHHSVVILASFDARVRVLLRRISYLFNISWDWYVKEETAYVSLLNRELKNGSSKDTYKRRNCRSKKRRPLRWLKVAAAAVVGTSLLVVSGGLAAPAISVGVGALGLSSAGTFIGTATGAALVTSLFGATGGTLAGYKMNRRIGDISEFEFSPFAGEASMQVSICISGFLDAEFDYKDIWRHLRHMELSAYSECFLLKWESKALLNVGDGVLDFAAYALRNTVFTETLRQTLLQGLLSALAWPAAILSVGSLIDNPWSVIISRSDKAGEVLADALLERAHGNRPVTLVGFSTGARVIMSALLELNKAGNKGLGIVENAFLLGCPATAAASTWRKMRSVVAGRLVNAYSNADWLLKFVFRAAGSSFSCSGLSNVDARGVENVNLSSMVEYHHHYIEKLPVILGAVGFRLS